jgi:MFS family permease
VGDGSGAGGRDLAGGASGKSTRHHAELLGHRLRPRGGAHGDRGPDRRLERSVSRGHPSRAHHPLDSKESSRARWIVAITAGQFFGYVTFGFAADLLGRRKAYLLYLLVAAVVVPIYGMARLPWVLLLIGPLVGFFGTGYFSGFGAITAELFPTRIRVTAQGFTYNVGRIASVAAPPVVGWVAQRSGFGMAFLIISGAFLFAAALSSMLPETRGKALE